MRVFLTEQRGWGVKTAQFIQQHSFVIELVGEPVSLHQDASKPCKIIPMGICSCQNSSVVQLLFGLLWHHHALLSNTNILMLSGEVISDAEYERRAVQFEQEPSIYYLQLAPGITLDARFKGNVSRLINTSCSPNCETQKWVDAATGEPCLVNSSCENLWQTPCD